MSDEHDGHREDDQKESRRQRAIDLVQTLTAGAMLGMGAFDTQGDKPMWVMGTFVLLGLTVFELDSKVYRLAESTMILAIPVTYAIWGGVDLAYLLTAVLLIWNGLDWAIATLAFINRGKKALVHLMETLG